MRISATIKANRFPALPKLFRRAGGGVVRVVLADIANGCRQRSRVDTGEMRDGWQSEMTDDVSGEVYNEVPHTVHNEYGTRHMPAQPMLAPSVDAARHTFAGRVARAIGEVG
jgi:hypothetical protein